MATLINFTPKSEKFREYFERIFQSSNLNFIFGAGASNPAIIVAGDIENRIQEQYNLGNVEKAERIEYSFLCKVQESSTFLVNGFTGVHTAEKANVISVNQSYSDFLSIIEKMLQRRRNNLLPKKVNIFTTNYDLFFENAALTHKGLVMNDGFQTRCSLMNEYKYDTRSFSRIFFESSALYDYKTELPVVNLIKMHGSMTWTMDGDDSTEIKFKVDNELLPDIKGLKPNEISTKLQEYYLIYPKKEKFKTTLLNHTYYDLMRIYSNELDKEQTTLIAFGFSFLDEHLCDLTKRALRNSTLKLIVFAFNDVARQSLESIFSGHSNVDIIYPKSDEFLKFTDFNQAMCCYTGKGFLV
jgi:hypothetical protein